MYRKSRKDTITYSGFADLHFHFVDFKEFFTCFQFLQYPSTSFNILQQFHYQI